MSLRVVFFKCQIVSGFTLLMLHNFVPVSYFLLFFSLPTLPPPPFFVQRQLLAWSPYKEQEGPEATGRIKGLIRTLDLSFKVVMYSEFGYMEKETVIVEVCFLKLRSNFSNACL